MDINDDIMNMSAGWIIFYNDGTILTEYDRDGNQRDWNRASKKNIKAVSLKWYNKHWTLSGKENYLQKKRAWVPWTMSSVEVQPTIQFRYIGYWEGKERVFYQVNEETGVMKIVVE